MIGWALVAHAEASDTALVEQGRRIYQEGILPSGKTLHGQRPDSTIVEGEVAACVKCHRQSGMGSLEGDIPSLPITGQFLFTSVEQRPLALLDPRAPSNLTQAHEPYTEASFAKALTEGVKAGGGAMHALMPRYTLAESDIKAVTAYLRQLSAEVAPGVDTDTLRFATVITPDVDVKRREVLIQMMSSAFNQRNASQQDISGRMKMPLDLLPRTLRNWELSVWELKGAPETWSAQLADAYKRQPVFAVVSGVSTTTWAPVQAFCAQEKLPCLFPSIPLPGKDPGFYNLYFSRGIALEADVLAKYLRDQGKKTPKRLVQVYRDNDVGRSVAAVLTQALQDSGIQVEDRVISGQEDAAVTTALKGLTRQDNVMLWLNPTDLKSVNKLAPKLSAAMIYASGYLLEGDYSGFSKAWKSRVRLVYPYELADDKRRVSVAKLTNWLASWGLPQVDEAFQSEIFFNVLMLYDLVSQMLDNLHRDYLVERAEDMLSQGANVTAYPHLSLASGQRFASKGAYIARFAKEGKLVPDSEWLVP